MKGAGSVTHLLKLRNQALQPIIQDLVDFAVCTQQRRLTASVEVDQLRLANEQEILCDKVWS